MVVEVPQRLVRIVVWQGRLQIGQTVLAANVSIIITSPIDPSSARSRLLDAQALVEIAKLVHIAIQHSGWKFSRCIKHCQIKPIDLIISI